MSCLRDVHFIRDTQGETAYHASIAVAFIVETIKIARRVAAQPARRTHTAAAVSSRAGASQAGNRSTADRSQPDDGRHRGGDGQTDAGRGISRRGTGGPETLRLYAADWAAFEDWCRGRALKPSAAARSAAELRWSASLS